ncbi:Conserved_hypothetical protein [Hexamita inflata]|uniref:Uncharacterized protein n=1 Tax=Hexamita inflata TaxID=28002 RepID=A0ABP1H8K4_9EUKA
MNVKTQVMEHILNLQQREPQQLNTTKMRLVLLGSTDSGKEEFLQYITKFQSFDTNTKQSKKFCVYETQRATIELFQLPNSFSSGFKQLHPAAAVFLYKYSDRESIAYIDKHLPICKTLLKEQIKQLNTFQNKEPETGYDVCSFVQTAEAEPVIIVLGIKDSPNDDIFEFKQRVMKNGGRIQDISQFDASAMNTLNVLSNSLQESFSRDYFVALERLQEEDKGCAGI